MHDTTTKDPQPSARASATGSARARSKPNAAVRLALATGLLITVVALGVVLSSSPMAVAGSDQVPAKLAVEHIYGRQTSCQGGGTLPRGTTAIRVSLSANIGPQVNLEVLSGLKLVTEGERDTGWGVDENVTVPVGRVPRTIPDARICVTTGPVVEPLQVNGLPVRTAGGVVVLLRLEYLRPGSSSWLSLVASVAHRMGLAHAPAGTWVAYLLIAVMLAVTVIASRLVVRELG
jgi:hypothetical protein